MWGSGVKNSSSESAVGTRNGFSLGGSLFGPLNIGLDMVDGLLGETFSPQVSCRRRGFDEELAREGPVVRLEDPSPAGISLSVVIDRGRAQCALSGAKENLSIANLPKQSRM